MPKTQPIPCSKEEIDAILEIAKEENEFDYMLYMTLKTTGRRVGELYGVEYMDEIGRKKVGERTVYIKGKRMVIDKTIPKLKKTGEWVYGVQVKDIDFEKATMKTWVLKRRQYIQDETILMPETLELIRKYINRNRMNLDDYVFRAKGRKMSMIQKKIKYYAKKAGIGHNVSIHNFRHYFVTELKRKGWSNDMIAKLTGHKTITALSVYDHIVADDIRDKAMEDLKDI